MNDPPRVGTLIAVDMDVGHHVVSQLALVALGGGEVDLVDMRAKLLDLVARDIQSQFGLSFGQPNPKLPPRAKLPLSPPQRAHLARSVAMGQRVFVNITVHRRNGLWNRGHGTDHIHSTVNALVTKGRERGDYERREVATVGTGESCRDMRTKSCSSTSRARSPDELVPLSARSASSSQR